MVPLDPGRIVEWVRGLRLVRRGAESEIRVGPYHALEAVYKLRVPKEYMDPELDKLLRNRRTIREAKVMAVALQGGVPAPLLYGVYPLAGLIVMEYIRGPQLKQALEKGSLDPAAAGREAGVILGTLHRAGVVHGDPTTSNFLVDSGGRLRLIDYGLAELSVDVEDRAVDLHLFRRAVEASHPEHAGVLYASFLDGYRIGLGGGAEEVIKRAREVALRGRYVEERRKTVWQL